LCEADVPLLNKAVEDKSLN